MAALDVGTGTGFVALRLAELGHAVTAIDQAERMLAITQRQVVDRDLGVWLARADAEVLPFANDSSDVVISRWLLPEPDHALAEWIRVLRPGGLLIAVSSLESSAGPGEGRDGLRRTVARSNGEIAASVIERRNRLSWLQRRRDPQDLPLATFDENSIDANRAVFERSGLRDIRVSFLDEVNRLGANDAAKQAFYDRWIVGPGGGISTSYRLRHTAIGRGSSQPNRTRRPHHSQLRSHRSGGDPSTVLAAGL